VVTVVGTLLTVTRSDFDSGWNMNLILQCMRPGVALATIRMTSARW
jgi:hypothetical protein